MQNKNKIIIAGGVLLFLLIALLIIFSLKKISRPVVSTNSPQKVVLEEKLDSSDIGLSLDYSKGFKIVAKDNENFSLAEENNSAVKINIQKIKSQNVNGKAIDIYTLFDNFKKSFLKIDKDSKFFNETKFIKNQNNNTEKFPGMGFEVQYKLNGVATKYFLAVIQKGSDFYVFSLSAPLSDYPNKIGIITSMLGTLNLK